MEKDLACGRSPADLCWFRCLFGGSIENMYIEHDFNRIWEKFSGRIRAYIRLRIPDVSNVDDILQEVFIKIHTHLNTLSRDANLSGWIYTIASNTIIDSYRRRKPAAMPLGEDLPAPDETCDSAACEIAPGLEEMARSLPEKYAEALLMIDFAGLSIAEASRQLGLSISGTKSRVQRARKMIKDTLLRCCHFVLDSFGTITDFYPVCCCCCQKKLKSTYVFASFSLLLRCIYQIHIHERSRKWTEYRHFLPNWLWKSLGASRITGSH